jgi:hypothetical protein
MRLKMFGKCGSWDGHPLQHRGRSKGKVACMLWSGGDDEIRKLRGLDHERRVNAGLSLSFTWGVGGLECLSAGHLEYLRTWCLVNQEI